MFSAVVVILSSLIHIDYESMSSSRIAEVEEKEGIGAHVQCIEKKPLRQRELLSSSIFLVVFLPSSSLLHCDFYV